MEEIRNPGQEMPEAEAAQVLISCPASFDASEAVTVKVFSPASVSYFHETVPRFSISASSTQEQRRISSFVLFSFSAAMGSSRISVQP